jgi:hypothetical protein
MLKWNESSLVKSAGTHRTVGFCMYSPWPLIEHLHAYMRQQAVKLSRGHDLAKAFNYILKRWASS